MTRNFDYGALGETLWDDGIVQQLTRIHEYKGRQALYLSQKTAELEQLLKIAKVQSTARSNKIEGIVTTDTRIRELLNETTEPRNRNEAEIAGYRDVLARIHDSYEHIPLRTGVIQQLHRDMYSFSGSDIGGRFKDSQNYIIGYTPDGKAYTRFKPLDAWETPEAVEAICEEYRRAVDSNAVDALLLICVFIADFLCIHPFNDGNGRISRLLTVLLLYQSGYLIGRYISLEYIIERSKETYYDALAEISIGWHEERNDYKPFIRYLLGVIVKAYGECEKRLDIVKQPRPSGLADVRILKLDPLMFRRAGRLFVKERAEERKKELKKAKRRILGALERNPGGLTKAQIMEECPEIPYDIFKETLQSLCHKGLVMREGNGKRARYFRA